MRKLSPALFLFCLLARAQAPGPDNVLVVVNDWSEVSKSITEYYALRRHIPLKNICHIQIRPVETINRAEYNDKIALPIRAYLAANQLRSRILYIVTTTGVPLRVNGKVALNGDGAAVDSELTLIYLDTPQRTAGAIPNPFFGKRTAKFGHPAFPIYLVTRLTGFNFDDVKAIVDRAMAAKNRGKFVIDLRSSGDEQGDDWLRNAAIALPKERVIFDESSTVLYDQKDVIGYAGWGSNDSHRKRRHLGFHWLPGAIATEFVSTNARTFTQPPENWNIGAWSDKPNTMFFDSPQTLTADYILGACAVVVDATGVGAAVLDMLRQRAFSECRLIPVVFTSGERETFNVDRWHVPKRDLMQGLAVLLEMGGLQVEPRLPEGEALRRELRQVKWEVSASGRDLFGGEREHDDLAMAVAMGVWWGRRG